MSDRTAVREEASKIEHLAKDALNEKRGETGAEHKLLEEIRKIEQDPDFASAVKRQIKWDNYKLTTLPSILITENSNGKISSLVADEATWHLYPNFERFKLDVDNESVKKMPRTSVLPVSSNLFDERSDVIDLRRK